MTGSILVKIHVITITEVATEIACSIASCGTCGSTIPLVAYKLFGVHQVKFLGQVTDRQSAVKAYLYFASLSRLGGYYNYTVTTACTIDGSQRGIL